MRWWFHAPLRLDRPLPREWFWLELAQGILGVLFLVALVLLVLVLVRRLLATHAPTTSRARAILDERYARGELTRDEYLAMRRDLESGG
jgi:putative membrane protein